MPSTIDMHAHYVSPEAIAAAKRNGVAYGVDVATDLQGRDCLVFRNGIKLRPFFHELCDLECRVPLLDTADVAMQIVSPWTDMAGDDLPPVEAARWSRLLNETMAADVRAAGNRFAAMGQLPMQDVPAAIAELDYIVTSLGMRSVEIGTHANGRELDDPAFIPLWRRISDLGVFVLLHPPFRPVGLDRVGAYFLNNLIAYPTDTTIAAARLIFSGLLDRLPDLKICLAHAGGFLPYQIGRLDRGFAAHPACSASITRKPSEVLGKFFFDTLTHDTAALRYLIDRVGSARVVYGSDYPFEMLDPTGPSRLDELALPIVDADLIRTGTMRHLLAPPRHDDTQAPTPSFLRSR